MKIITVSGKSGSGKSYIAEKLAESLNCKNLNLDNISHKTLSFSKIKNFVKKTFGESVFDGENINRKKLGEITFNNAELLNKLNNICQIEMEKIIDKTLSDCTNEYIILEYLLLPKMKYFEKADFKILVTSNDEVRKQRILKRDKITEEYFDLREKNSINFDKNDFDIIFENKDGSNIEKLVAKIKSR